MNLKGCWSWSQVQVGPGVHADWLHTLQQLTYLHLTHTQESVFCAMQRQAEK